MSLFSNKKVSLTVVIVVCMITGIGTYNFTKKPAVTPHTYDSTFTVSSLEINENRDATKGIIPGFSLRYRSDFVAKPVLLSTMPSYGESTPDYREKTEVFNGIEFHSKEDVRSTYEYQDYVSYYDEMFGEWNNPEYTFAGNETYGRNVFSIHRSTETNEQNLVPATVYMFQVNNNLELMIWHDDTTGLPLSIDLASLVIEKE